MAASDPPTDETIDGFLSFIGGALDRASAIRVLKYHNNDANKAVDDFFDHGYTSKYDNPPASQQTQQWDEQAFNTNRDGSSIITGNSFTIQGDDELPPLYAPPTRPPTPSRTSNNRSPQNAMIIDLSAKAAAADPSTSKTFDPNDDPELAQALAASMQPQESGVTSTNHVAFGPANRSQYDPGDWAMVPVNISAREILLDPEPEDRKRDLGAPGFLKPSADDNRLAALLTIYHEIPLIREIFLDRANTLANYGTDREWWAGKPIELPTISGTVGDGKLDFVQELQRLMAFLDKTERSYGSAEVLANLPYVKAFHSQHRELEKVVLEAYKSILATDNHGKIRKIFSKGVDGPGEYKTLEFAILDLPLPEKESGDETIYDIADSVLWGDEAALDLDSSPFLKTIGEVIAFHFTSWDDSKKKRVAVPAVWYPDRYLESGREAALEMRLKKKDVHSGLEKTNIVEQALTYHELHTGKRIKIQELFEAALQHDQEEIEDESGAASDNMEKGMLLAQRSTNSKTLSAELRKLADRIDQKLLALNEEKEKARELLRELSKLYTQQSNDPNEPTLHPYTLRGVSTSKNILYICKQAEPDLIEMDLGADESQSKGDQWWKIHYATSESKPVNVEKTTQEKVLEAASESTSSMLVYASEKAMTAAQYTLAPSLETFVRNDNVWFKHEFPASSSPVAIPMSPNSPSKRKNDTTGSSDEASQEGRYKPFGKIADQGEENIDSGSTISRLAQISPAAGKENQEVIMGICPSIHENSSSGQEMQERSSMRMLSARAGNASENAVPIDNMDLDQVMEDENVVTESGAVKTG